MTLLLCGTGESDGRRSLERQYQYKQNFTNFARIKKKMKPTFVLPNKKTKEDYSTRTSTTFLLLTFVVTASVFTGLGFSQLKLTSTTQNTTPTGVSLWSSEENSC